METVIDIWDINNHLGTPLTTDNCQAPFNTEIQIYSFSKVKHTCLSA